MGKWRKRKEHSKKVIIVVVMNFVFSGGAFHGGRQRK